jgi:predicted aldo/keto reductase-like oxidoreductase
VDYLMQNQHEAGVRQRSKCVGCGKCEAHCPQRIEIRKELKTVASVQEPFYNRPARAIIKRFMAPLAQS